MRGNMVLPLTGLILAAGKGKRMQSETPKVLHSVAGEIMLARVLEALRNTPCQNYCVILGEDLAPFESFLVRFPDLGVCVQKNINGTAGAVASSSAFFQGLEAPSYGTGYLARGSSVKPGNVLVCAGDIPGLDGRLLRTFIAHCQALDSRLGVLGMRVPDPTGYGRLILSHQGTLDGIVEEKDADANAKKITLCNSGVMYANVAYLFELLGELRNDNAQGEYYLTDCVAIACKGQKASVFVTDQWQSLSGVNSIWEKEFVERTFFEKKFPSTPPPKKL
ncbi:MAG: NTP transferase domain-containing protein [Deltaproteobacteria bacterium]|nr:NTP transferase domain-containing protein [Deltaproteobacteria bacterium]